MKPLTQLGVAVLLLAPFVADAQVSKTIPGETRTMNATVEAIEASTRAVTVKKENGEYEVRQGGAVVAGRHVKAA